MLRKLLGATLSLSLVWSSAASADQALLVFGGKGHDVFLGCLNCDKYAGNSIQNSYGPYGSKYSETSILNRYSDYGSKYSDTGACNEYANDAPVIVDNAGNYYGKLSLNKYGGQTRNSDIVAWLTAVCSD
ncbi:hypothetical protein FIV34_11585 [Luteibacter pinisoli]|uniref:Cytochrome C n=1 Tax=Luteibacter pinisoli TaxID=2589080 RepID=A0A4Y5Z372_9GAMM|nr:hypothetical protein [Luteibacter pinisoli]QDE39802.1 hypothetical protein FIV34_11585 [Luteibacter pinisoli]